MASVTIARVQRASGLRFKAILRDELGQPLKSKTFTKLTLAREWARRLNSDRELVQALGTEAATLTLSGLIAGDPPYRPAFTVPDARQWQVDWWEARLGDLKLVDITADRIRLALNEYGAGTVQVHVRGKGLKDTGRRRSPASVNRLRAMLASMYRHARLEWGFTADSPLRAVPAREERNRRRVFLSVAQAGKLLDAASASSWPKLHLLVLMGITTGARRGELEGLRWSDIDFAARTALLRDSKNGDPRILTIPPDVMEELERFRRVGDSLVFARPGNPYQPFTTRDAWHEALVTAGLTPWKPGMREDEGFRFHDLRHSTASFLAARGASLLAIGEVLGHRSTQTTKRYSHLVTTAKQRLTDEVFGELLAATRSAS
jgi:integrase